jgi:cytochrome P450
MEVTLPGKPAMPTPFAGLESSPNGRARDDSDLIPGPGRSRLLGARANVFRFFSDPVAYMRTLHRQYGEIAAVVAGTKGAVFAFGPRYNEQVLGNPNTFLSTGITMSGPPDSAHRRVGFGLLSMNGAPHRHARKLVMPAFHGRSIEACRELITWLVDNMLKGWKPGARKNIVPDLKKFTLKVATHVLFDLDTQSQVAGLGRLIEQWISMDRSRRVRLFRNDFPGTPYRRMLNHADRLESELLNLIHYKRAHPGPDVLSLLIASRDEQGETMTDAELVGQANILFGAAYETTHNALCWTLFLLATHPDVAHQLLDELEGTLHGDAPNFEQLGQLGFLDNVIRESLRILPPVTMTSRQSNDAFELGPYHLPRGTNVAVSHYITHHLPELYTEPERFMPGRWSSLERSSYEYLPFGAGPRMCLGASFAKMTLKIAVAMIHPRFRLELGNGIRIDRQVAVTLSPKYGLPATLRKQDRGFRPARVRGNINECVQLPEPA